MPDKTEVKQSYRLMNKKELQVDVKEWCKAAKRGVRKVVDYVASLRN